MEGSSAGAVCPVVGEEGDLVLVLLGDSDPEEGGRPRAEVRLLGSPAQQTRPSLPPSPRV